MGKNNTNKSRTLIERNAIHCNYKTNHDIQHRAIEPSSCLHNNRNSDNSCLIDSQTIHALLIDLTKPIISHIPQDPNSQLSQNQQRRLKLQKRRAIQLEDYSYQSCIGINELREMEERKEGTYISNRGHGEARRGAMIGNAEVVESRVQRGRLQRREIQAHHDLQIQHNATVRPPLLLATTKHNQSANKVL